MNLSATLALIALFAFLWVVGHPDVITGNKNQEHVTNAVEAMPTLAVPERKPVIIYKCPPKKWPPTDAMGKPQYWTPKRLK